MDAEYLKRSIGGVLDACLAEVVQKKPWDPIEYISQWLYKHQQNANLNKMVYI